MVLLTIVTTSNPHTISFDHAIEKPSYIRAVSSLPDGNGSSSVMPVAAGNYAIDLLAEEFNNMKNIKSNIKLIAKTNTQIGSLVINNPDNLRFSVNLVGLLGVNPSLAQITTIKQLNSPTTYFIHCDLIDKRQNLVNGKPSTVLARFDIRGKPFEKVRYQTTQQHVLRDTSTGDDDVNSLTISVRDEKETFRD